MECADIKALMSEYLDDALEAQTRETVEKHVSTCSACEEELAALRAVVDELGSLKSMAAPDDFLARLHERLERGSSMGRLKRKLFSPFHIKLPLELAGAAAVAVLVFAVLNIQQTQKETVPRTDIAETAREEPMEQAFKKEQRMAAPSVPETPLESAPGRDRVMAGKQVTKAAALADKNAPAISLEQKRGQPLHPADTFVELAVLVRPKDKETDDSPEPAPDEVIEREAPRVAEERALPRASEGLSLLKGEAAWEGVDPDALLASVKELIENAAGDISAVSYDERTRQLKQVTARIPTANYRVFAGTLRRLAALQKQLPDLPDKDAESTQIRITFLYPD